MKRMMLIRMTILILMVMVAGSVKAQQLTEQQARERVVHFLTAHDKAFARGEGDGEKDLLLAPARVDAKSLYAFNREGGGYVIASADSRTLPILGYSDTGCIDWEQMPENMRLWLRQYDEAVATLGGRTDFEDGCNLRGSMTRSDLTAIEPLIQTNWYQIVPYNNDCPLYDGANSSLKGKRCMTGCGATAMAQVMNFYQWPKMVADSLSGYDIETTYKGKEKIWHIDALPPVTFEWQDMLDCYLEPRDGSLDPKKILGTEQQQQAVATLMRYCGQAMKMKYSPDGSGSATDDQLKALKDCFGYAAATDVGIRSQFVIDEWEDIIYQELADGRPVLYYGFTDSEGHSFVCDGYDGDGLFHVNWGWGGKDDGYFALSVLNPYNNSSAGAASSGIGFSINQGAFIYLDPTMAPRPSPAEGKPRLFQYSALSLEDEHTVRFEFCYLREDAGTATVDHALGTYEDGVLTPRFMGDPNDRIIYSGNYMLVEIDSTAFQPGDSLRLYPMLRFRHAAEEGWQRIPPEDYCACAGRTEEGAFYIYFPYNEGAGLSCIDGAVTMGTAAVGERSDVTVTVDNHDDHDFVGELCLVPYYYGKIRPEDITEDTPYAEGDTLICGAYLRAGQEGEVTFSFRPTQEGVVRLLLITPSGHPLGAFMLEINEATGIEAQRDRPSCATSRTDGSVPLSSRLMQMLLPKGIYIKDGRKYVSSRYGCRYPSEE